MKFCKDCLHFDGDERCLHPSAVRSRVSPVWGLRRWQARADEMRGPSLIAALTYCGSEARLFQEEK